ncbi:TetR/AcrR family transcriptional regulator [Novosphingobium sp. G106]|uniref:TetR/AcrR family transcriptional regulator n=1 Tax=Novosphingobium sp. G106 TaxID=2849500 RepID=UPI001C2DCE77|nr:TetR/AcrR family transcriptional regulator [Novosphingobium sp. G106]MBV1686850.1 TetR/AcrR family transcriptional regulator [Novosphingobium sp. G106]
MTSEATPALSELPAAAAIHPVSHNLNGQRLGRKGRDTRERILAACTELLADPEEVLTMSAVARRASLGMTSLYNYFADLTELLLAVLEPVMATAEESFLGILREHWPDTELGTRSRAFIDAYHGFWARHSRLLHLRNTMADSNDHRLMIQRVLSTQPLIALFVAQMGGDADDMQSPVRGLATVLMTGIERTVTVATDTGLTSLFGDGQRRSKDHYLVPASRMIELMLADTRARLAQGELG